MHVACFSPTLSWKCHKALLYQCEWFRADAGSSVNSAALKTGVGKLPLCCLTGPFLGERKAGGRWEEAAQGGRGWSCGQGSLGKGEESLDPAVIWHIQLCPIQTPSGPRSPNLGHCSLPSHVPAIGLSAAFCRAWEHSFLCPALSCCLLLG